MAYTRINWQDLPSTATPRNATNLNKMDSAIKEHDDKLEGNAAMGNVVVDSIRSKNMFDKTNVINAYLDGNGNTVSNADNRVSDYIDVSGISKLTISGASTGVNYNHCFYNSSKTFISKETINTATATMTVPSNAKYVRVTVKATQLDVFQLEMGTTATTYSPYQDLNPQIQQITNYTRNTTYVSSTGYLLIYKYGKICVISLNVQLVDNTPSNTTLLSGLPKGAIERITFSGALNNGNSLRLYITSDGEIKNDGVIYLSGASGWINSFVVYFCE